MKTPKYVYLFVFQGCYDGHTWDDLVSADQRFSREVAEFRRDCRAYRENEPQYPHRVIERREANPEYAAAR